ncbi:catalase [Desulfoscipio sp. XC116]|uniref:catalase n=1 Tax=Desulfoscipio sp. XC116 TaxID=3144975 RepID=UPI00325A50FC
MSNNNEQFQSEKENTPCTTGKQNEQINCNQSQSPFPNDYKNSKPMTAPAPGSNIMNEKTGKSDVSHSQTVGVRGPVLVQDTVLHETLETFVFSTTLPRRIHTKGYGAFGYFCTTHSMKQYTKAGFLQTPNQQVPVAVRFSLAASNLGTPDTSRNVRGFSTRFYTNEGIFDLLCNHIAVFFVRDAIRVPDVISHLSPSPVNNLTYPELLWSLFAKYPEATNMLIWLFSDLGTVKSFRHIKGYSVSTYVWRNAQGVRHYVKYHWLPMAGAEYINQQEAQRLACQDPDIAGRDLYDSIAKGKAVEYQLCVQLMDPEDAKLLPFDPLDDTKVWDEAQYPLLPVGRMVLNRNPENYAEQVEKLAFAPANLLPGLEFSDDKVLQGRTFIYSDAQRHRLGPDFRNIPVNKQPNWSPASTVSSGNGRYVAGEIMRAEIPNPNNFTQATQKYESFSAAEKKNLVNNIASGLVYAQPNTQRIVLRHLEQVSPILAEMVKNQMLFYAGTVGR